MEENKSSKVDAEAFHWEKLSHLHPTDVCNRTGAIYNPAREGFVLPVYHLRYLVLPKTKKILRIERNDQLAEESLQPFFSLMVLAYLADAKEIKPSHVWVSEKDLRGGFSFFQGPHSLQVKELEILYGDDPEAFLEAGRHWGGSEILYGNKGFALDVFPKVPLAYLLWTRNEEFSPKVKVLFDATIESHLPLDIIWCMVTETTRRLAEPLLPDQCSGP